MSAVDKFPNLNRENAKLWIEALESGEYTQTKGVLKRIKSSGDEPVGYCCLGVLCEVSGVAAETNESSTPFARFDEELVGTPKSVDKWLGIVPEELRVDVRSGEETGLVALNDYRGWTFEQIARELRAQFDIPKEEAA